MSYVNEQNTCKICNGKGVINEGSSEAVCESCDGSGKQIEINESK